VTAGRYVSDDVFLSLGQEFGRRVGQVASVEYRITRYLAAKLSTSVAGSGAVDLLWHRRY
jgi:autotransporter translocation and assembly factor TamB